MTEPDYQAGGCCAVVILKHYLSKPVQPVNWYQQELMIVSKTDLSNTGSDRVKKPGKRLYVLSPDEEIQRLLFMQERALCDEASLLKDAEERGVEFGIEIGMQRGISIGEKRGIAVGKRQGQVKVLTRQLCRRFRIAPTEIIARVHSGSAEQLEQWADNILTAETIEEVFLFRSNDQL